jgi:hypothetical protein
MKPLIAIAVIAVTSVALAAGEKPPADAFSQSPFEFALKIPSGFKQTASNTGYFPTPVGNVPYEEKRWDRKDDTISTKVTVMPELWWQHLAAGAFAGAKQEMLGESGTRLISERHYAIGDCRAYSLVVALKTQFQRIDYILMKPDVRVVMYISPKEAALNEAACTSLFQSVSIKPKATHTP